MKRFPLLTISVTLCALAATPIESHAQSDNPAPPQVGDQAPGFELPRLNAAEQGDSAGKRGADKLSSITLEELNKRGPVVLVVLRGWPGYQCPLCSRQVGQFLNERDEFARHGVQVVMIYPGPAEQLAEHAREFQGDRKLPDDFHLLIDPDYQFTDDWGLRWDAARETAYPSTFIIGKDGRIKFGQTSSTHGDRVSAKTVLAELARQEERREELKPE
jgi:peroxiredoxin